MADDAPVRARLAAVLRYADSRLRLTFIGLLLLYGLGWLAVWSVQSSRLLQQDGSVGRPSHPSPEAPHSESVDRRGGPLIECATKQKTPLRRGVVARRPPPASRDR